MPKRDREIISHREPMVTEFGDGPSEAETQIRNYLESGTRRLPRAKGCLLLFLSAIPACGAALFYRVAAQVPGAARWLAALIALLLTMLAFLPFGLEHRKGLRRALVRAAARRSYRRQHGRRREPLPYQESASWQEFEGRFAAAIQRADTSPRGCLGVFSILLVLPVVLGALVFDVSLMVSSLAARLWWVWLAGAACTALTPLLIVFVLRWTKAEDSQRDQWRGVWQQWRARAEQGEIPWTSSDGPKVWRYADGTEGT